MLQKFFIAAAAAFVMLGSSAYAQETCQSIAAKCVATGGGQAECFEANRMATCRRTGEYVSPRGNVFKASGKPVKKMSFEQCMRNAPKQYSQEANSTYCRNLTGS